LVNLRIPGPIPVDDEILHAMSSPMINHRGPEFEELLYGTTKSLKKVFSTNNDLYIITGSGTSAMEAAVVNTLSPGDTAINATVGLFGNRFGIIAKRYGVEVVELSFPFGSTVDLNILRKCLDDNPETKAVMVTHNETSTGVTNDLEAIAKVVKRENDKLLLVDGISSVCSIPMETDSWGIDVATSASQKGWMLPPGLAFITFSKEAWKAHEQSTMPRFYLDVAEYQRYYEIGQPPFTPSLSCMFALDTALQRIEKEGLGSVYERHLSIGQYTRDSMKTLGLELFPTSEDIASNTCTAVKIPQGLDGSSIIKELRENHQIVLAGGQGTLNGKIFRIGHMGLTAEKDIDHVADALRAVLPSL